MQIGWLAWMIGLNTKRHKVTPPTYSPRNNKKESEMQVIKVKHYQEPKAGYTVIVTNKDKKVMLWVVAIIAILTVLSALGIQIYV